MGDIYVSTIAITQFGERIQIDGRRFLLTVRHRYIPGLFKTIAKVYLVVVLDLYEGFAAGLLSVGSCNTQLDNPCSYAVAVISDGLDSRIPSDGISKIIATGVITASVKISGPYFGKFAINPAISIDVPGHQSDGKSLQTVCHRGFLVYDLEVGLTNGFVSA
jgi:hypothetical protein